MKLRQKVSGLLTRLLASRLAALTAALLLVSATTTAGAAISASSAATTAGAAISASSAANFARSTDASKRGSSHAQRSTKPSRQNRELWATIDVCKPSPTPAIGIRGSMPSNGKSRDLMYMRFIVEYLNPSTSRWSDLGKSGESGFIDVGLADTTRQGGRTFELAPLRTGHSFRMRGVVEFQWRHGAHVVASAQRTTTAGHRSDAGATPRGFSAAACTIG